jgi:hypothetical protein
MSTFNGNYVFLTGHIADVSTAGQIYIAVPEHCGGEVMQVSSALNGAITGADADLTPKIGGTAMTNGLITIAQSGSAAGDVDTSRPTGLREVVPGDAIEIETDGASSGTVAVTVTVAIKR